MDISWRGVRTVGAVSFIVLYGFSVMYTMFGMNNNSFHDNQTKAVASVNTIRFQEHLGAPNPNIILELVNEQRTAAGLPALVADEKLGGIASLRAKDMATRKYYSHQNPDGARYVDFLNDNGLNVYDSCENLDMTSAIDEQQAISDWLSSTTGHKECLLRNTVTSAGYAVEKFDSVQQNGQSTTYYVVVAIHANNSL